ncbi:MAG: ribulose 1,5-bisphosphate carboxylase [Acidobacteria bacterium]|nr:ribulose 1,5-bisphosphate carboxylase [Acidobacteriota bacterium]
METRLKVHFCLSLGPGDDARQIAQGIALEQTAELPLDQVPDILLTQVVGRIEQINDVDENRAHAVISYSLDTTGGEAAQLLNLLFGNISMKRGFLITQIEGLDGVFPGPSFGIDGMRKLTEVHQGALVCTALKPMGRTSDEFATMAFDLACGGMDIIKDDHGLANQRYAPFAERVPKVQQAVIRANDTTNRHALYAPNFMPPITRFERDYELCLSQGIKIVMVCPWLVGWDMMAEIARRGDFAVLAHPSLAGGMFSAPDHGMTAGVVLGQLFRSLGADASIYPNVGGRFVFDTHTCHAINAALREPYGAYKPSFPVPAGGMTLDRIGEMSREYGDDLIHLIGGGLMRAATDLRSAAALFRRAVRGA